VMHSQQNDLTDFCFLVAFDPIYSRHRKSGVIQEVRGQNFPIFRPPSPPLILSMLLLNDPLDNNNV
jgi:hypothetical protein